MASKRDEKYVKKCRTLHEHTIQTEPADAPTLTDESHSKAPVRGDRIKCRIRPRPDGHSTRILVGTLNVCIDSLRLFKKYDKSHSKPQSITPLRVVLLATMLYIVA